VYARVRGGQIAENPPAAFPARSFHPFRGTLEHLLALASATIPAQAAGAARGK
jgi:hypothetical protein